MVILEGCDGSGKSTLGKKLLNDRVVDKVLDSPAITKKDVPLWDQSCRYLSLYGRDNRIAVDRFLFSEMVYGPILRGNSVFSSFNYLNLLESIMISGSFIIFCIPEFNDLDLSHEQNPKVKENIRSIYRNYIDYYKSTILIWPYRTFKYVWNDSRTYENLAEKLR